MGLGLLDKNCLFEPWTKLLTLFFFRMSALSFLSCLADLFVPTMVSYLLNMPLTCSSGTLPRKSGLVLSFFSLLFIASAFFFGSNPSGGVVLGGSVQGGIFTGGVFIGGVLKPGDPGLGDPGDGLPVSGFDGLGFPGLG